MERVFHHFKNWEDHRWGMYETTCFMDSVTLMNECEQLLSCPQWLRESMVFVALNWTHSAEHMLTNTNRNRRAWLGQAACCLTHGAPEYVTKLAWHNLTAAEQEAANAVADDVIALWEERYARGLGKCLKKST